MREEEGWWYGDETFDVVTANPPYISRLGFNRDTERSVRNFEPQLALVPPGDGGEEGRPEDIFYGRIVERAEEVGARILIMEVAGTGQAGRVARMVRGRRGWGEVEIWRDFPEGVVGEGGEGKVGEDIVFRGVGEGRSVVCWRAVGEPAY